MIMDFKNRLILKIGAVFVGILLFLTFFSNTIYNFNLPNVTVDYAREGVLTRSAEGRGIVDFIEKDFYYADETGKIAILVSPGDLVPAGGALYSITADIENLRQSLEQHESDEERIAMRLDRAKADGLRARENLSAFVASDGGFDPSEHDFEINRLSAAVDAARRDADDYLILYESGAVPRLELEEKQAALESQESMLTRQIERKQAAQEEHERASGGRKRELERLVSDMQIAIADHEFELGAARKEAEKLRGQIQSGGAVSVLSENGGYVLETLAQTGARVSRNELVMTIGALGGGFKSVIDLPENVDYISLGDQVVFSIDSKKLYGLSAEVRGLVYDGGRLKAEIGFESEGASGGETARLLVSHTSELYEALVPNRALRTDDMGEFLLYAEMVEGSLRSEYFARKLRVRVIASDNRNSAVWIFAEGRLPIIVNSDKAVSEGDRIRIVGGNEIIGIR